MHPSFLQDLLLDKNWHSMWGSASWQAFLAQMHHLFLLHFFFFRRESQGNISEHFRFIHWQPSMA
jgi:hypothetical protein